MFTNPRFLILFVLFCLYGCATTTAPGAVGVERQQLMTVSEREVNQAAEASYHKLIVQANDKGHLIQDGPLLSRVKRVASRLIPVTAAFRTDAPKWKWEANVLVSQDLNAWCMPGGKIAVFTGLIERLELTDDELAAVMGHEVAHALREHGREKLSRNQLSTIGLNILSIATGMGQVASTLTGSAFNIAFNLPHDREAEIEADRIGLELAARAGYNPRAAISLWDKMEKISEGKSPAWISTHPSHEFRKRDLAAYADQMREIYERAYETRCPLCKSQKDRETNDVFQTPLPK